MNARLSPETIKTRKNPEYPLVCLTAYTAPMAAIIDAHCDIILVGDSLGMVIYGMDGTTQVTTDMMINHGKAVSRVCKNACLVVDMPFGTYEDSPEQAVATATRLYTQTQCDAVKLEGGVDMAPMINAIVKAGIPVMGHIGLQPQQAEKEGGFSFVIEGTIADVSKQITQTVSVPTIGIGACVECDGQILVTDDMLTLTPRQPKFVRHYADLKTAIGNAVQQYADDVRTRKFPDDTEVYKTK